MPDLLRSAILLLLLCSCTLGPDYRRPEVEAPPAWRVTYAAAADLIDLAWWRQFDDPVLDELIASGLAGNLDLLAATARVDQYLGQWRTTRAELYPQFGAGAAVARQDDSDAGPAPPADPYSFYQAGLNASWEIDLWGRLRRTNEAARAEMLASEAGRRSVLLNLVANLAGGYVRLRGFDRQLEIARETERAYAESLRIFRLRHQHGTVSRVEVSQVESEYENARQTIPQLEAQIAQQEHLLSLLLGRSPQAIPRGRKIDELSSPGIPAGLPSQLLEQRPDIIQAEQALIAANARLGVARSLYFPQISLTGAFGASSIDSGRLFASGSQFWQVGADALAPIFTFGAIEGQVMTAEAAQREALHRYRQAIVAAFRDVEDALAATTKGRESRAAKERRVAALATYARLARSQYDAGTTSYLQVLDANRSLFAGQLDFVQTQTAVLSSLVDVYRSLGGGWLDSADREAADGSGQPLSSRP